LLTVYADDAIDLDVDLLAIFLLAFVLYFRTATASETKLR
jgi:hypothetical protein